MYLYRVGTAKVDQLASVLDFTISKTYSVISALEEKGLVAKLEATQQERYAIRKVTL
jgi:DNA-binding MarR family transcriptional regulator